MSKTVSTTKRLFSWQIWLVGNETVDSRCYKADQVSGAAVNIYITPVRIILETSPIFTVKMRSWADLPDESLWGKQTGLGTGTDYVCPGVNMCRLMSVDESKCVRTFILSLPWLSSSCHWCWTYLYPSVVMVPAISRLRRNVNFKYRHLTKPQLTRSVSVG